MRLFSLFGSRVLSGLCLVSFLLVVPGCGPDKKPAQTEAEVKEEYDYRNAIQQYKIGVNYLSHNEPIQAIDHLKKAIENDENNFRYQHALGLAYSMNGQLDDAVKTLKQALSINPTSSETYNLLGSIYTDQSRHSEAIAAFKKVIMDKSYPEPQFAYFNLGLCMRAQKKNTEAQAAFAQAVRIQPDFHRAYVSLAELSKEAKDYRQALFYYQKAEPGFSNNVNILYEIGYAMFKLKDFDRAKSYLAQVSILFPPPNIDKPTQDMLRYIEKYQREARR